MAIKLTKYIFVTGGVISGLGKGITAASIGWLLQAHGLKVNIQKCDPYLNVDAGTLNPREHGECFVTKDGAETDLDLGHYERFIDQELTQSSSLMSGRVLLKVIEDERAGKAHGHTVQIIPHVTGAIQDYIIKAGANFDVHIVEIGGTVGDYESLSFYEAIRELNQRFGRQNCAFIHVVYVPFIAVSHEFKTKPAQNSVRDLRSLGITPDMIVVRSEHPTNDAIRQKLSLFCGVTEEAIVAVPNQASIYQVPLVLEKFGAAKVLSKLLNINIKPADLTNWQSMVKQATTSYRHTVNIAIVAKYLDNSDTYKSVIEALQAAAWYHKVSINIKWIDAEKLMAEPSLEKILTDIDGIVVPGGFGARGVEGKIRTAQYAFQKKIPYLGLCLGLQVAVIAAARNAGLTNANSTEFNATTNEPVIATMTAQKGMENTGGTMRLGDYPCVIEKNSKTAKIYNQLEIVERHRHRYECNNDYRQYYTQWGITAVGTSPNHKLVEIIEATNHPFMIASQFHPEFKSRPNRPHPLFSAFISSLFKTN